MNGLSAELARSLEALLESARDRARSAGARSPGRTRLGACVPLPREIAEADALALLESSQDECFWWDHPEAGLTLYGEGAAATLRASGPGRFRELAVRSCALLGTIQRSQEDDPSSGDGDEAFGQPGPLLLGGLAFEDADSRDPIWRGFPAAQFMLPRHLFVRRGDRAWLFVVAEVGDRPSEAAQGAAHFLERLRPVPARDFELPERRSAGFELRGTAGMEAGPSYRVRADRAHRDFEAQVQAARRAIALGELQKVVLARALDVQGEGPARVAPLLAKLRSAYPACVGFAMKRGDGIFVGATPELLISMQGRTVRTAALAGSAPRGRDPEADAHLGRQLIESKKEQEEHRFVVDALREVLAPACTRLEVPESPRLLRLEGIQHLETPIRGLLAERPGSSLLELAGNLHPSPAVGGVPRRAALDWLDQCEGLDRGWFAGPIGFLDAEGGGELRVALRSGLIRGSRARLFAGAGIVSDSQPDAELEETRVKLRALLAPLTEI